MRPRLLICAFLFAGLSAATHAEGPGAAVQPGELLKTVRPALDDLASKPDAQGVYAIAGGELLKLGSMAGLNSLSVAEEKKSQILSGKTCFILYADWLTAHAPDPGSIYGYDWRLLDVKAHPKISFTTQPVPGHPDMLLVMPAEALKPGLYSLQADDSAKWEFRFGVETPDEEAYWSEVVKEQPDSWHAHSHLGAKLYMRNDIDGALEQWKRSVELKPQIYETHNNYGLALNMKGRVDEALEQYKQAVAAGGNIAVRMNYAQALQGAKHYDDAIKQYDAVQKLAPDNVVALRGQGSCYYEEGDCDVAAKCFEMALKIKPDDADVKDRLEKAKQKADEAYQSQTKAWRGE